MLPAFWGGMIVSAALARKQAARAERRVKRKAHRQWLGLVKELSRAERKLFGRAGWARVLRNTVVGFVKQAGTRMAAALSYYALLAAGPLLVLTIALGSLLLGDEVTRAIIAVTLPRLLPPSAGIATSLAEGAVQRSEER